MSKVTIYQCGTCDREWCLHHSNGHRCPYCGEFTANIQCSKTPDEADQVEADRWEEKGY